MKLRRKIGLGFLGLLMIGIAVARLTLSYTEECPEMESGRNGPDSMQSIRYHCYGPPEVLRLQHIKRPTPANDELLVQRMRELELGPEEMDGMRRYRNRDWRPEQQHGDKIQREIDVLRNRLDMLERELDGLDGQDDSWSDSGDRGWRGQQRENWDRRR